MRVFREEKSKGGLKLSLFIIAIIVLVFFVWYVANYLENSRRAEGIKISKEAVVRASVQCYAIEGRYPPDLKYLEDNYGLTVNSSNYIYNYETVGENIMPKIEVLPLEKWR